MKIAVARHRKNRRILGRIGPPSAERYGRRSVQRVLDGLRELGHEVKVVEGDMSLPSRLRKFLGPMDDAGRPGGLVFNLCYGIQGDGRYAHVPALLEMIGVPYTGAGPRGHLLSQDKVLAKLLMQQLGIPTPAFTVMRRPVALPAPLDFPVVVKPRLESSSHGLFLVRSQQELERAVRDVVARYRQDALVEAYVPGREITASLLGNEPLEVLPLVEYAFGDRPVDLITRDDKFHKSEREPAKLCPAPLPPVLEARIVKLARRVFAACECRDYARVDLRLDAEGHPSVLEINSMPSLGRGGAFVLAATRAGIPFPVLLDRIAREAWRRAESSTVEPAEASKEAEA